MNRSTLRLNELFPALGASITVMAQVLALTVLVAATACGRYRAPGGPEAAAALARYNGTWLIDADASDRAPESTGPLVLTGMVSTCSIRATAGELSYERCRQQPIESAVPDSVRTHAQSTLTGTRPNRLTIQFTDRALHLSGTGPGYPLALPLDSRDQTLDHLFGDVEITAWVAWDELVPVVEFSIEDGGWISDRYEITPDGTLTVTRTTGHDATSTGPSARFSYTRADAPPS